MRLRYMRVGGVPALPDVALRFRQEPVFRRPYGMHFVVGVNGSGKTRLLASLVETFLSLEQGRLPPFPVTLVYELGRSGDGPLGAESERICWLHHQGDEAEAQLAVVDRKALPANIDLDRFDWDRRPQAVATDPSLQRAFRRVGAFSALGSGERDEILPRMVLVYTSGALEFWEDLFGRLAGEAALMDPELALSGERPVGWDTAREEAMARADALPGPSVTTGDVAEDTLPRPTEAVLGVPSRVALLSSPLVPLAAWAAVLETARQDLRRDDGPSRERGFSAALERVGWIETVTLGLRLDLSDHAAIGLGPRERTILRRLHGIATFVRRDPDPGTGRLFAFDLRHPVVYTSGGDPAGAGPPLTARSTAGALAWAFGQEAPTAYDVFRVLHQWARSGLLTGVTFALAKEGVEGLVTYEDLSDGERMFVGRMALLHLLKGTEGSLVVLDEPETHFNDTWKREIVDVIDSVMRNQTGEVVISTHSSLTLTDAFDSEIVLVQRVRGTNDVQVVRTPIQTFGGSPGQIMRHLFDAPTTTGQRATEYLDMLLLAASHPDLTRVAWDERANAEDREAALTLLAEFTLTLPHPYGDEQERREFLRYLLRSVHQYAREQTGSEEPSLAAALEAVQDRLGSGYYEFEFIRRADALAE